MTNRTALAAALAALPLETRAQVIVALLVQGLPRIDMVERARKRAQAADEAHYTFLDACKASFQANGWRVIRAEWAGVCPVSGAHYAEGAYVWYRKGDRVRAVGPTCRRINALGNDRLVTGGVARSS